MGIYQHLMRMISHISTQILLKIETPKVIKDRSELFRLPFTKQHRKRWGDSWYCYERQGGIFAR